LTDQRPGHDASYGDRDHLRLVKQPRTLRDDVDRHPRGIHDDAGRGGRRDERGGRQIVAEQRGRSNPALIADETAERAGKNAGNPAARAPEA